MVGWSRSDGAFENLTENYLLVVTDNPGDLFDDAAWNRVIENWRIVAEVANDVGFTGIQFDNEEYFGNWDDFPEDYSDEEAARGPRRLSGAGLPARAPDRRSGRRGLVGRQDLA